ncbi:MAG: zinc metallopeptidase [Bacilli bacterium]|nr:zinc metallopeptidase [Bacilli bacterium]
MYLGYESPTTLLLLVLGLAITIIAQVFVKNTYNKYRVVGNKKGLTGFEVARKILDKKGLTAVHVVEVKGLLTDHYDPRRKVVRLSTENFHGDSIASVSVAAHEVGHALQHKEGYIFMSLRSFIFPLASLGSRLGYFAVLIGFIFSWLELITIGVVLLISIILFELVTLPVEYDASAKAKKNLEGNKLLDKEEIKKANNMLNAAALTYVAAVATSLLQILRLILMSRDRD